MGRIKSEGGVTSCFGDYFPLHVPEPRAGNRPPIRRLNLLSGPAQGEPSFPSGLAFCSQALTPARTFAVPGAQDGGVVFSGGVTSWGRLLAKPGRATMPGTGAGRGGHF